MKKGSSVTRIVIVLICLIGIIAASRMVTPPPAAPPEPPPSARTPPQVRPGTAPNAAGKPGTPGHPPTGTNPSAPPGSSASAPGAHPGKGPGAMPPHSNAKPQTQDFSSDYFRHHPMGDKGSKPEDPTAGATK